MFRMTIVAAGLLAIAGCATGPTVQDFAAACAAYGYQPGTDAFAGCVQQEVAGHREGEFRRAQAFQRSMEANRAANPPVDPLGGMIPPASRPGATVRCRPDPLSYPPGGVVCREEP